jgi:Putative F0F1-ATPase subunit Ca2+/Mg2+ transporter
VAGFPQVFYGERDGWMADDDNGAHPPDSIDPRSSGSEAALGGRDLIGLGAFLAGAVIGGMVLGILIDEQAGTSPTFTLIGIAAGILLGAFGFWARVRRAIRG